MLTLFKRFVCVFLLLYFSACRHTDSTKNTNKTYTKLTILHINDTHGYFFKHSERDNPDIGGFPAMSTLIKEIRKEVTANGGEVLFLHAGDLNTGVPESDFSNAIPDIIALNEMKLDAMVLGNHEFDNTKEIINEQIKLAEFPILAANIKYKNNGSYVDKPFIVKTYSNTKVHIIGLLTDGVIYVTPSPIIKELAITPPDKAAKNYIKNIDKNSLIIALTHLGIEDSKFSDRFTSIGDSTLASMVPEIDIIVGGHSHSKLLQPIIQGKTLILQSEPYTKGIGRLDLKVLDGEIIDYRYKYIPINHKIKEMQKGKATYVNIDKEIPEDKELIAKLQPFADKVQEIMQEVIGQNNKFLPQEGSRNKEIALGNLITDAMLLKGKCDVAIQGGSGIRNDLPKGSVTIRNVFSIHPFGNVIVKSKLSGSDLVKVLQEGFSFNIARKSKFLQISGAKIKLTLNEVIIHEVANKPFDEKAIYTLCSDNFLSNGGEGMDYLKNLASKTDTGFLVHDGLIEFIKAKKIIEYDTHDRIRSTIKAYKEY